LYNTEKYIYGLFSSLKKQEFINKNEYEIILLDDGSSDSTLLSIEKYKYLLSEYNSLRIIKNSTNKGQGVRRFEGAKIAKGIHLAFVDAKTRPNKDYFWQFEQIGHNTIIGNVYIDKNRSVWDRFNHNLRVFIYRPYYGVDFQDISLDYKQYENFKLKGGGGALWTKKEYFIRVNKSIKFHRYISDDSMIIGELSKIEPVIKSSKPMIQYLNRKGFVSNIEHTFSRGPKFVLYYFRRGSRYYAYILFLIFFLFANLLLFFLNPELIFFEFLLLFLSNTIFSVILSQDLKDFLSSFTMLPLYLISFSFGILKGLFIKFTHQGK